jgi:hypothetical protein
MTGSVRWLRAQMGRFAVMAVVAISLSCESEGEESPILVFLSPNDSRIEANSNDHVFLTIESRTVAGANLRLYIQSVDPLYGVKPVLDSLFAFKKIKYLFDYMVPVYPDSTESILIFTLMNDEGDQIQIAKRLFVNKGAASVKESSGNIIYSSLSSKPNAFSLPELTPVYLADSLTRSLDIIDASVQENNPTSSLSKTWVSRTNLLFVKFSGFNYADANAVTINNSYKSGIKLSRVTDLKDSDILIVGKGNKALGAIQIISVADLDGKENDKYVFSVKKLLD